MTFSAAAVDVLEVDELSLDPQPTTPKAPTTTTARANIFVSDVKTFLLDRQQSPRATRSDNLLLVVFVNSNIPCALRKTAVCLYGFIQGSDGIVGIETVVCSARVGELAR